MIDAAQTLTVRSFDGATIVYDRAEGQGAPVVLIHGWSCRREQWREQGGVLGQLPVLALDLAGHGDSGAGDEARTPHSFARDVQAVLEAEDAQAAVLVGHSMGGAVALEAARQAPSRVAGVVLVDTFVLEYGGMDEHTQQALYEPFAEDFAGALAGLVDNTAGAADETLKRRLKEEMAATDPASALPAWRSLLAWNPEETLAEVSAPVHAINGDLIPQSSRERCARYVVENVIPGTGHFLHLEAPERFNPVFLRTLEALR